MANLPLSPALLPASAPFQPDHIAALNGVMATATVEQRNWLSGFLAGYQAASGPQSIAAASATTRKLPLSILFATESGNAETLAADARKAATKLGFAARVLDMADVTPAQLAVLPNVLLIASTWGEGEPPQRAADLYATLMADDAPRLDATRFAVLALGDRAYAKFCEIGRRFDERLEQLGATRVTPRIECDLDYETEARNWLGKSLAELKERAAGGETDDAVIHVDFARAPVDDAGYTRARPFEAEITDLINLNGSRSSSRTFHVELSLAQSGLIYEPGDAIGLQPVNDPELVEQVLSAVGLGGDSALHNSLSERFDITTLTQPQIRAFAGLTGDAHLTALAADDAALAAFTPGRQVIDLLELAPHRLTGEQLQKLLRPLPPRLYSVASSLKVTPDEAHLLIAETRYETFGRQRKGVASTYLSERRSTGQTLKIHVKANPHFRLPLDPQQRIIMVGPGTGVAPYRGFLQERAEIGATGANWLFFGARNFTHDFLYQLEWQDLQQSGVLTRMDVAFSRDQRDKIYVQDRMWDARRELFAWLQEGAAFYVCGDGQAMAKDVHATLLRIIADQQGGNADAATAYLDAMRRGGRYLRDVY